MKLSIVIPVFNEEESLEVLFKELISVLKKMGENFEVIFVDDGSTDRSLSILTQLAKENRAVRLISFRRNLGKAEALMAGFQSASGENIVTLDADLQDQPSEIPMLIKKLNGGVDVVCGWRKDRHDLYRKRIASRLFNSLASSFWGLKLHDYNCGLKAYKADTAKSLILYGGLHRFIPLLAFQEGYSVIEIPVTHRSRKYGVSKYKFSKLWKDFPDIFTMLFLSRYSKRPLHFFGVIGTIFFLVGFSLFGYLTSIWFMGESIGRRPLLLVSVLLMLGGMQVFLTGFLAELFIHQAQQKRSDFPFRNLSE